jgi:phosphatidylglycerophosphatase A
LISQLDYAKYSTQLLSILCLFLPGAYVLAQGGRNGAIFISVLVITIGAIQVKRNHPFISSYRSFRLIIYAALSFVVVWSLILFIYRGHVETSQELASDIMVMQLQSGNNVKLKNIYQEIDELVGHRFATFFMASFYLGHSIPFFSSLFYRSDYEEIYWGAFLFKFVGYIFWYFGLDFPQLRDIVESQPYKGLYPTAVQGFLLDFGVLGAPFAILFFGLITGLIYKKALRGSFLALVILPIFQIMAFVFPIYPVGWGMSDFVLYSVLGIYYILIGKSRLLVFHKEVEKMDELIPSRKTANRIPQPHRCPTNLVKHR